MKVQRRWPRSVAFALVIIATVFWLWFGIGSAYVEGGGLFNWLMHILLPGGIFLFSALVAWRWGWLGGGLFVLEGLVALGFILNAVFRGRLNASTFILMFLTLGFPPLAAGVLFLASCQKYGWLNCWKQRFLGK